MKLKTQFRYRTGRPFHRDKALGHFVCLVAGLLLVSAETARACEVNVGIPDIAPFAKIEAGKVTGVVAEVTVLALRNMGCRVRPRKLPFARMYNWVHGGRLDVATAVHKTPERAALAHYSAPIISEFQLIMVPKDRPCPLRTLDDLAGMTIGGQLGFFYPQFKDGRVHLMRVRSFEINVNRVAKARLDGIVIGSISGPIIADRMALADQVAYLPKALDLLDLGVALSTRTFSKTMHARFDGEIRTILNGRLWTEILKANNVAAHRKSWPLVRAGRP